MKLALISDTHGEHEKIKYFPTADIFIHCGDVINVKKPQKLLSFKQWLSILPYSKILLICGNHDIKLQNLKFAKKYFSDISNVYYLGEEEIIINNVKFYGISWNYMFQKWAYDRNENSIKFKFDKIPNDTNVLITHGAPYRILDFGPPLPHLKRYISEHAGSIILYEKIQQLKYLKLHSFGHIHEARGQQTINNIKYVNCAMDLNNPKIIEIEV